MVNAMPQPLHPRDRPGTHCIGGWVGPRASPDVCGKSCPPPGKDRGNDKPNSDFYGCSKINNIQTTAQINISKHY